MYLQRCDYSRDLRPAEWGSGISLHGSNPEPPMSALGGEFNESTQHLLILPDEEVCGWRGMHGHGSRQNRGLSVGALEERSMCGGHRPSA
jgi:hypothetical protein